MDIFVEAIRTIWKLDRIARFFHHEIILRICPALPLVAGHFLFYQPCKPCTMKKVHDHSFNVNVAEYFRSVEKAILLKELYGWIKINKDNNRNIYYGVAWTYNSAKALNEKFRYMHPKSIWRWINELSGDGLICINRFNEKKYDKTNWYTINWAAYAAICEGKSELIEEHISHFKKFQKLVFNSQNEKSISQNKKRYSQNEESISQSKEPIPSLTNSSSSLTNSEPFAENKFSTVLIEENEELKIEVHHVPDYFNEEPEKKERKDSGQKKETAPQDFDLVHQVVEYLNEKNKFQGLSFKSSGKQTQALIYARKNLDKWTLDDFKTVIDFKVHEWGKSDKMRHLLCPSTLFRACHAETYLTTAKAWKIKPNVTNQKPIIPLYREEEYSKSNVLF